MKSSFNNIGKLWIFFYIFYFQFNNFLAATKQLYQWLLPSVRLSVCDTFVTIFPSSYHHEIFWRYYQWQKWCPCKRSRSEVKGVTTQLNRFRTVFTNDDEMLLRRVALLFFKGQRSNFKVTQLTKIVDFDPNWAFPDCNSSLNAPMATKWCIKLEVAQNRCPIVFQGHPSNFKITWLLKSTHLTHFGVSRL